MQSLKEKQNYLKEHIPEQRYQEFSEYLIEQVGNLDIEKWSKEFIVQIVNNYLVDHPIQNNDGETSFYIYQQKQNPSQIINDIENIKIKNKNMPKPTQIKNKPVQIKPTILQQPLPKIKVSQNSKSTQDLHHPTIKNQNVKQKNHHIQEVSKDQHNKNGSAITFIDNVINQVHNGKINKEKDEASVKEFLTFVPTTSQKVSVDFSLFDNRQFWSSSTNNQTKTKQNINFDLDFAANYNTTRSQKQINRSIPQIKRQESPISLPEANIKPSTFNIPNFDDLIQKIDKKQKIPSPYLKKDYVQQKHITPKINNPIIKLKKVPYTGVAILKSDFKDNVKCFQSCFRTQLKADDLMVVMQDHEIIQRSFLMPDYVMYSIRVIPLNIKIKRNYQDITNLKKNLSEFYPGIQLPYLEKSSWFNSTNADNVKRQKIIIEQFLNHLISNQEIRHSKLMEDFLMILDHKAIKRKFQQYEKLQKPKSIQQLCLLKGSVDINISENQRIYQQNLKDYHEKMTQYLQKHQKLNFTLANQYQQVVVTLNSLAQLCKQITSQTDKFNQKVYSFQIQNIQKIFSHIQKCYKEESNYMASQLQTINRKILPFINYEKLNLGELQQYISNQQSFLKNYIKRNQYQKIDPSIPYTSDKIKPYKYGIMNQSKNFTVMMYQAGYFSNQLCNEAKRLFEGIGTRYGCVWKKIQKKNCQQLQKKLQFWKKIYESNDNSLKL